MTGKVEFLQERVTEMLQGVNRYNPGNCGELEEYVEAQLTEEHYDADANLALLKLYQLNPDKYSNTAVVKVLLKALMALPCSDLTLCKSLIDSINLDQDEVRAVCELAEVLEKCQFRQAWERMETEPLASHIRPIKGFREAIMNFVCHTVGITYQSVAVPTLMALLGTTEEAELKAAAAANGWSIRPDGYVFVANQEATVRNKNIQEKIELQNLTEILHLASKLE